MTHYEGSPNSTESHVPYRDRLKARLSAMSAYERSILFPCLGTYTGQRTKLPPQRSDQLPSLALQISANTTPLEVLNTITIGRDPQGTFTREPGHPSAERLAARIDNPVQTYAVVREPHSDTIRLIGLTPAELDAGTCYIDGQTERFNSVIPSNRAEPLSIRYPRADPNNAMDPAVDLRLYSDQTGSLVVNLSSDNPDAYALIQ